MYCNTTKHFFPAYFYFNNYLSSFTLSTHSNVLLSVQLLSGDVEINPGPKLISKESF